MLACNLNELITKAMKERETELLNVLKLIKCEFVKAENDGIELNEVNEIKILKKMSKQREDSIKQYIDGGRVDLADNEKYELGIINGYLPKEPDDKEIDAYTLEVIENYKTLKSIVSMKDMKPIMALVQEKYPSASGKIISKVLGSYIKK